MPQGGRREGAGRPRTIPPNKTEAALKRRKLEAQCQLAELELAKARGQVVDAKRAESTRFRFERVVRDRLLNWPTVIAGQLIGALGEAGKHLSATAVAIALDALVRTMLISLADDIYRPGYRPEPGDFPLPYTNGEDHDAR